MKHGLELIKSGIEKTRENVLYWTTSSKKEENFHENSCHVCIPITKSLVFDCSTRWNSTYLMFKML